MISFLKFIYIVFLFVTFLLGGVSGIQCEDPSLCPFALPILPIVLFAGFFTIKILSGNRKGSVIILSILSNLGIISFYGWFYINMLWIFLP